MELINLFNREAWDIKIAKVLKAFYARGFYKALFYHSPWKETAWLGKKVWKMPLDLWVYQEMICEFRPDFIIECGTFEGGSAFYFASIMDLIHHGKVITIDINTCSMEHPRVVKIVEPDGGSVSPQVVERVGEMVKGAKCMVILDSSHRTKHVEKELEIYTRFVPVGGYVIVEDTCLAGNPVVPSWRREFGDGGPMEAVERFLKKEGCGFVVDREKEKYLISWFPRGYLRRVA
ncbi:MAG: CmcI family methyltransferase [candidate division NC10 bacterium]